MGNYKGMKEYQKMEVNPFLDDLFEKKIKKKKVYKAGPADQVLVNKKTGEVEGHTAVMSVKEVDEEQFVKIYASRMSDMWSLSKPAQKVFSFIAHKLKPNQDTVQIAPEYHKKEIGYKSKSQVVSGIAELLEKEFIAKTNLPYTFFINPNIFFNGSRISFIDSYINKDSPDYQKNKDLKEKANDKELPNSGEGGE